ncbi:MAG TPA: pyridoxal phosphate-dependent aminotransferase [Bacteroidales bacterium]|nr:MAG: Aspartate aminotransferase [Bacteroidetes bacterium ADurb.Bin041]HNV49621.1 pyridoxal phosphate-dependent aminotransferase [Bacteroidales bacterium]HPW42383.1 pyridoxal phosphate-dependent aminotransferase [Bacteroidales bacterium]
MIHHHLSNRVNSLSESATLQMTRRSRELKDAGIDVINLSIGEPDFDTPESVKAAGIDAIQKNITHYPPVAGFNELRKAIAAKLKRDNNLDYAMNQIIVSGGAKQSIANALLCLVNPGDEVIIPAPYWVSYPEMVKLAEGKSVIIPSSIETNFKVTAEQVEKYITPKSKLFIFSSPCNPSGSVYSKDELEAIAKVLAKKDDLYVVSDEIYEMINFVGKHESIAQFDFIKDRVVVVNGVSKGFAMTGWRIGYSASNKAIADACNTLQGQYTSGSATISQMASLKALQAAPSELVEVAEMQRQFRERRDYLLKLLADVPGMKTNVPDGAFYVFPEVSYYIGKSDGDKIIKDDTDLCLYLLNKAHVALVPGSAFGGVNYIRFSYACSKDDLTESVKRIKKALEQLK